MTTSIYLSLTAFRVAVYISANKICNLQQGKPFNSFNLQFGVSDIHEDDHELTNGRLLCFSIYNYKIIIFQPQPLLSWMLQ